MRDLIHSEKNTESRNIPPRVFTTTVVISIPFFQVLAMQPSQTEADEVAFLNCKRNSPLQVFASTSQKVPLRHSKLCHLNSERRTIHVEDRHQYCMTTPRLRSDRWHCELPAVMAAPRQPAFAGSHINAIKGLGCCASGLKVN